MTHASVHVSVKEATVREDGKAVTIDLEVTGYNEDGEETSRTEETVEVDFDLEETAQPTTKAGNRRTPTSDPRQRGAV